MRGAYPAILDDPRLGAAARDLHRDARRAARTDRGRWPAQGERGGRLLAGEHRGLRRHRRLAGRGANVTGWRRSGRCASRWPSPTVARTWPSPTSSPRSRPACPTTSAPSRSRPATDWTRSSPSSKRPTTTTRRSSPRPWPTGWPRHSPSGSTSGSAASCGATPPTRPSRTRTSSPSATRASGRRPAIRPARTTRRRGPCSRCSRPRSGPASGSPSRTRCGRGRRSRATTSGTRPAHYFGLGRIGHDQLEDYARRKGMPVADAERWLAPNLADES